MYQLYQANSWELMHSWPDACVDHIICDPPDDQDINLTELQRICKGNIICFCKPENQYYVPDEYLFWIKTPSTKNYSRNCGRFVEMILVKRGPMTVFNPFHWSQMTGVYDDRLITRPMHPYEKPLALMERLIRIYSHPGQTILDPFAGSGTTLFAAHNTGRNAIGIEIDVEYYNLTAANWINHSTIHSVGLELK